MSEEGYELSPDDVYADEGYSGSRLDRPGLDALREGAEDGAFEVIAVLSPDRLARKYACQVLLLEEFGRAGCGIAFLHRPISEDPDDQLLLQIRRAIAEYERALLGKRFGRGKLQKAREGHFIGGRAPYGYRHVPKRDGVPGHLVVDETEAELVRTLYEWPTERQPERRYYRCGGKDPVLTPASTSACTASGQGRRAGERRLEPPKGADERSRAAPSTVRELRPLCLGGRVERAHRAEEVRGPNEVALPR